MNKTARKKRLERIIAETWSDKYFRELKFYL